MRPCFCCRDVKRKRHAQPLSSELYIVDLETKQSQESGWNHHWSLYNGEFVPLNSRKGLNTIEPVHFSPPQREDHGLEHGTRQQPQTRASFLHAPATVFPVSCVTNNTQRSSKCDFPKLDEDKFRVLVDALFIVIILSILSADAAFEFKGKDEVIEQRGWITHSGKMALYLFLNV